MQEILAVGIVGLGLVLLLMGLEGSFGLLHQFGITFPGIESLTQIGTGTQGTV